MEVVERVCGLPFLRHGNGPYLLDSVSIDCTEKCGGNTVHFNSSKNSLALIHAGIKFDRYSLDYIPPSFFFLSFFSPFPFPFFSNNRPNGDEILVFSPLLGSFVIESKIDCMLFWIYLLGLVILVFIIVRVFFSFVILNQVGTKEELGKIRSARCVVEKGRAVNRGIICLRLYSSTQYPPGSETFLRSVNRD